MATFDLKKQLTIHDRGLLRQLLGKEPSMQGIDWGAMPRNNIDPLIAAWEELEDAQKRHYQVVLQDVQHLADPKGQRVLIEELEWRHPGSLAKFAALLSPSDKALWAYLKARDAFDSAAIFARAELLRNGQQANIWNSLPKKPIAITDDKLSLFEHQIRSYYWTREMRGELCKVHQYDRHDGSQYFFAYLPDWPDSDDDPVKPVYQLDQLLDPSFAFETEESERIADVKLRRIRIIPRVFVPTIEQVEFRFSESTDLPGIRSFIATQLASMQLTIDQVSVIQAGIQFQFMGDGTRKGRPMTINVSCPNTCDLKSKPEEQEIIGRACFVRWGILNG